MIRPKFSLERVDLKVDRMIRRTEKANVRALFRISAFIATTAKRSMRKRKKASPPGTPPSAHEGDRFGRGFLLRELMQFEVERKNLSAVIGPKKIRSKTLGKVRARKPVPNLHEFGGALRYEDDQGRGKRAVYPARPYMAPALEKARANDKLRGAWGDILGKASR